MEMYLNIMVFVFGAIIGSFLNVVIYRMHTGKSLDGRSHCMSCGTTLMWYELFPLFSYIALRARCRTCSAYIPSRYLIVELLTGLTYLFLWQVTRADLPFFFLNIALFSILIVLAVYDVRHTVVPDELSLAIGAITVLFLGYRYYEFRDLEMLLLDVVGGCGAGAFFGGLWYVSKGRWLGLGDAKLALPLGMIAGFYSAFSMVVFAFWVGAAVSICILGIQHILKKGKTSLLFLRYPLTMKSEVPFAPFLIVGFLIVHLLHVGIFDITLALFTL